jgi:hypothetical protein
MTQIARLLKDAGVERQPRQFAIDEALARRDRERFINRELMKRSRGGIAAMSTVPGVEVAEAGTGGETRFIAFSLLRFGANRPTLGVASAA